MLPMIKQGMPLRPVKALAMTVVFAGMAGCASTPAYHAATSSDATGFSEQKLDENHYRVTFKGNSRTSRHDVEDYLLLRAAEVTRQEGFTCFHIDEKSTDTERTVVKSYRPAFYGGLHRYHYHDWYEFPYYAYGFDWGYPYDSKVREYKRYDAVAYITLTNTPAPDSRRSFNAANVIANLKPDP